MDSKKHSSSKTYRGRLLQVAAGLILAIAALGTIQRAIGTRGWDFSAGILTIIMVALVFVLAAMLFLMLPGRLISTQQRAKRNIFSDDKSPKFPWDEPSWYDPSHPGSPSHRND